MLPVLAFLAFSTAEPLVSTDWLQAHLNDPQVRVICTGDRKEYDRAHVPSARFIEHMDTVGANHRLPPLETLARTLAKAGAVDNTHIVLYGDSPMTTGWVYMTLAAIGHGADVSMLDGNITLWQAENRPVTRDTPPAGSGTLTVKPAPDVIVDAAWVRSRLESPSVRLLDVRTSGEWNGGHLPGATLILWQDLFADRQMLRFKSKDEIRGLLARAGVGPSQEAVTYCAVGMRASLMYWAAQAVGIPARVYLGSWEDWRQSSTNPVAR